MQVAGSLLGWQHEASLRQQPWICQSHVEPPVPSAERSWVIRNGLGKVWVAELRVPRQLADSVHWQGKGCALSGSNLPRWTDRGELNAQSHTFLRSAVGSV